MLSRSPNHNASDPVLEPDQLVAMIPALRAFARKFYREREDVEDLVQETLVKAIANRSKYVPYAPLKSWLFTIMRNTFCTRIRIQTREAPDLMTAFRRIWWSNRPSNTHSKRMRYNLPSRHCQTSISRFSLWWF
ncbi:hypothetical protein HGG75_24350 [Ochrobactrum pseudogrignonense]|nr:hypothetical protein [Brucella pseudogrignonensis]